MTGISGVILARNEERNIAACIEALLPHVNEIIVIDMESTDRTVEIARSLGARVLHHPLVANFDAARNIAIDEATQEWLWVVDADERVPEQTGRIVCDLIRDRGHEFEAISIPFKSYFCGQWMRYCGWWPGYTMPRVLKRGHFRFSERLHGGVEVDGREIRLPPDPAIGVDHFSYESIEHYIEKFNRYTSTEAQQLSQAGKSFDWRESMAGMMRDLWQYYEVNPGRLDGERGWILSWLSGQYRWLSHAKLIDCAAAPPLNDSGPNAPVNLDDVLLFLEEELSAIRRHRPLLPLGIHWRSPIFDYSGYADESRAFIKAIADGERALSLEEIRWNDKHSELALADRRLFKALLGRRRAASTVAITDCIPGIAQPDRCATFNVLRTTFETDRIPREWLEHLNAFDEIWVTSNHAARAFRRSWVPPEKIRVVHPCFDSELFRPDGQKRKRPEQLEDRFLFLSVLEWQLRKGWDVLLRSYVNTFSVDDDAGLLLKITSLHGQSLEFVVRQANECLSELGTCLDARPDIVILDETLSAEEMAALYRSTDAFVLPTRGEGWGRPIIEAMACGTPVIATFASGPTDFLTDNTAILIPAVECDVPEHAARELPTYAGHRWFEPDQEELSSALRRIRFDANLRLRLRECALGEVFGRFDLAHGCAAIENAVADLENRLSAHDPRPMHGDQVCVELEGELFAGHSFSHINEQIALRLAADPSIALSLRRVYYNPPVEQNSPIERSLLPYIGRTLDPTPQVIIRHSFPPNFQAPQDDRLWIHIQPWEFGHLPVAWIEPLKDRVDEIWAPSRYVRKVYEQSGIPAGKIQVIPWGIDPEVFNADAPPWHLPTDKQFKFLFVGGSIARKGFDLLLEAFRREFKPEDDVCLVVKDIGTSTFYRYGNYREQVFRAQQDSTSPQIIYLDGQLTPGQLASLYTACDAFAAPYRGEGFGLPILEAMACGLAPIVPLGGASDDFVDADCGYQLPAREIETEHEWPLVGPAMQLEVNRDDLQRTMRRAASERELTKLLGRKASNKVHNEFTWDRSVEQMRNRIGALARSESSNGASKVKPCLAACLRFGNSERELPACLARLAPFVDEIIAIDEHSSDRSAAIAREYGAKVVQRNGSKPNIFEHTAADWFFWVEPGDRLDADELDRLATMVKDQQSCVDSVNIRLDKSRVARRGTVQRHLKVQRRPVNN